MNLSAEYKEVFDDLKVYHDYIIVNIDDKEITLNTKIKLCENCGGEGRHLRTSLRGIAFSPEDQDYDPDFMEEMRNGCYDQRCTVCNGQGRIKVVDENNNDKNDYEKFISEMTNYHIWQEDDRRVTRIERGYREY